MHAYEKLGALYLGKRFDLERDAVGDALLLYDAKDLTTHAVCVGMTGSGKTGLCLSLLEEAAIDGIPAIAIDPKGDLGNLLLTFPDLSAGDFRPWIDPGEAARHGATPDAHARAVARRWRKGLATWDQDGDRIARLRRAADFAIYTPGSDAGLPLAVLRSFAAPGPEVRGDADARRERVAGTVSGLLALVGIDADPIRSREYILLASILDRAWSEGLDLDLAGLIQQIQKPPLERVGVFDLESFFPARERFALAMTMNNLLASPGFAGWLSGEPLDIQRLLWTPEGRPRVSILSIAHLSDAERMFFVSLLLHEVVAWMRRQAGTSTLRALLYMDEVFGFFPPTANPPSKTPMLTLLKQARAYGLGVVLATQNPVDLDYKGLSNAGTWFLGRLQTDRDKQRVLDGLEGASAAAAGGFDRSRVEAVLAGLKSRVFLMHNVHDDAPCLFHTRWALSYLRGPLTRPQIQSLMARRREPAPASGPWPAPAAPPPPTRQVAAARDEPPALPPGIEQAYVAASGAAPASHRLVYRPALLGRARLHHVSARHKVDHWSSISLLVGLDDRTDDEPWADADRLQDDALRLDDAPAAHASFADPPGAATQPRRFTGWGRTLKQYAYRELGIDLWQCPALKAASRPGESEGDFRARLGALARERRDLALERLRKRYAPKLARLKKRIRTAEQRVQRERAQYKGRKVQAAISIGTTLLGALFGRKMGSVGNVGRAATAARGIGKASSEKQDIARAEADVEALRGELADLEAAFERELDEARDDLDPTGLELAVVTIRPRKSDIATPPVALAWTPWQVSPEGIAERL